MGNADAIDVVPPQLSRAAPLRPPRPPPAPETLSSFRRILMMRISGIAGWTERAYQEDMLQGRFLGHASFTLNNPDAIRHVLIDNDENYGRTPPGIRVLRPVLGEGLLLAEGRAWKLQRRTLAPAFTPRAVGTLVPHMRAVIEDTVSELDGKTGHPLDLREVMQRMTLEIAGRTMFSFGMAAHGPALRAFIIEYGSRLARPHLWDMVLPLGWPSPQDAQRAFFRRRWRAFVRALMAERRAVTRTGEAFSDDNLIDQVATMILAGHETTATALFWALLLLAQDRTTQDEVAREARAAGPSPEPEALKFTRAVLDETMRLYPPAYLIARQARGPDTIAGHAVRKGDVVFIAPWLLHRHVKLWDDPDAFVPQRFLTGTPPDRFAYLPFGVGPRICIGAHFALTEATLALARIVGAFRIERIDATPVMPIGIVTTQPDHSPLFKIAARS